MRNEKILIDDAMAPVAGIRRIGSRLGQLLARLGIKHHAADALHLRIAKAEGGVHRIECFDPAASSDSSTRNVQSPYFSGFANGSSITIFLHDQSIVSGVIVAQDDEAYTIAVSEWTYFDNNVFATMHRNAVLAKVERLLARATEIVTRCNSILADGSLVHFNRNGAIIGGAMPFSIGDRVQISLDDQRPICGIVRWHFMGLSGLEFLRPMNASERQRWAV